MAEPTAILFTSDDFNSTAKSNNAGITFELYFQRYEEIFNSDSVNSPVGKKVFFLEKRVFFFKEMDLPKRRTTNGSCQKQASIKF